MEVAPHLLAAPGVHVEKVVDDLRSRGPLVNDLPHPGGHLVAGAILRTRGQQPDGVDEIDEPVRTLPRRLAPELVQGMDEQWSVELTQTDVLDRDDLQPPPDLILELRPGAEQLIGDEDRVLDQPAADRLLQGGDQLIGRKAVLRLHRSPRIRLDIRLFHRSSGYQLSAISYRLSAFEFEVVSRKLSVRRPAGELASRHEDMATTRLLTP